MYWFIFLSRNILLQEKEGTLCLPQGEEAPVELQPWTQVLALPELDGQPCRAFELNAPPKEGLPAGMKTVELRSTFPLLPAEHYRMAGKAAELIYWDQNTRYCGYCGAPTAMQTAISKRCTQCGKEIWPTVSPAIIVRITRNDQVLLVHARNFRRADYFGLVAGFLETGETLEACVRREVMEETGLTIRNLRYFGSQPWPFPSGIMVGFTAEWESGELRLQQEELSKGGWYSRDNLPHIPDKSSIARRLIDDWLLEG